jgi:hypothetical protein
MTRPVTPAGDAETMSESSNRKAVVVPIDRYLARSTPESGQLALFETSPATKLADRTRRPLTRQDIEHRRRMLTFLTKAR